MGSHELAKKGPDPDGASPQVPLVELEHVSKAYLVRKGILQRVSQRVQAVTDVSIHVGHGETVGVVGESGSGKSTLARVAIRLTEPTTGVVRFQGTDISATNERGLRWVRRQAQMVFQDPYASFDPLTPLAASVSEPLAIHGLTGTKSRSVRLAELVELVGLNSSHLKRYPRELSGGQLQRMAIARALAVEPRLLVLDEPVSALDVSTQAQVINLLMSLQQKLGLGYLFISHNPALVRHASDRIAVMYLGEIVEIGPAEAVYNQPKHPYTEALMSAVLVTEPDEQRSRKRIVISGDVPSPADPPRGCRFHTRCPYAMRLCETVAPAPYATADGTVVHCHLHTEGPRLEGAPISVVNCGNALKRASAARQSYVSRQ